MSSEGAALPFTREVLDPDACRRIEPALTTSANPDVWVYRYTQPEPGWVLSIATHGRPGSRALSLGGFRIAPEARTSQPGYDNDREAIELAMGMEEKIYWSRLLRVGGPRLERHASALVGGKCVLRPSSDGRVGQPHDAALLDFAVACMEDFEAAAGVLLTTGQDLGHGTMSGGRTTSLRYLNARFPGSMLADTAKPTAEGNYRLVRGMLAALDIPLSRGRVGLIGCGNIGDHVLMRLEEEEAAADVLEANETKRRALAARGVVVFAPVEKEAFLELPLDAVLVNAAGGSLDADAVRRIAANPAIRVVAGSENLAMPDPAEAEVLRAAGKVYCPTELGGMMGYLTAVEEYLAAREGQTLDVATMYEPARRLETAGREITALVRESEFTLSFEEAARRRYGTQAARAS